MTTVNRQPRLAWPLAVLVLILVITLLAAGQAWTAVLRHRATSEQLLRDYAAFGVWTYRQSVNEELGEAAWFALNPILHENLHYGARVPSSSRIPVYLASSLQNCRCEVAWRPELYFGFTVGADTIEVTAAGAATPDRGWVPDTLELGPARSGAEQWRWIADTLKVIVRSPRPGLQRLGVVAVRSPAGEPALLAYGLMPTTAGDTTLYGFIFDPGSLPGLFTRALVGRDILPPAVANGRPADSLIAVQVHTPDGARLYQSAEWLLGEGFSASDSTDTRTGALRLEATVLPALSGTVFAGQAPVARLALLLAMALMAAGLTALAIRQLRQERRFTRSQADFVAAVSHELRTPLAQIRLFLETLRLGRYDGEAERDWLLGHVDRETLRLSHLVSNILQFSRRQDGAGPVAALSSADLAAEVAEVVRGFQPLAESRRVRVTTDLAAGALARFDRELFRQLLLNLLDNAVKYGPEGQQVHVSVARDNGVVRLAVADQGPGIAPALRRRVWEPFVRGSDPTARAVGGHGIGLSVVQDAARRHGATVRLDEAPGGGSRFIVEFPAVSGEPR